MSVVRMGEVTARAGKEAALRAKLESLVPRIAALDGCEGCELLQSQADPAKFVIIERWVSVEAHKGAVQDISPEEIAEFMELLEGRPAGEYYTVGL